MKVGEYVRTKDGVIAKITDIIEDFSIDCDRDVFHAFCEWRPDVMEIPWNCKEEYIIKSSPNIIDLIELGDLVRLFMEDDVDKEDTNIFEVIAITDDKKEIGVFTKDCELDFYPIENLRGIVTSEQFSQMEYRIGE